MELKMVINIVALQMIIVLSLVFIAVFFMKIRKNFLIEKKFSKYVVEPIKKQDVSILDQALMKVYVLIRKNGEFLKKFKILVDYSKKYNKYISFDELKDKVEMDFISAKFLIALTATILYIINQLMHYNRILFFELMLIFAIGFFVLDIILYFNYRKKRKKVEEDLLKAIIIMNNTFKSGKSIVQAIEVVKDGLTGPISDEFKKIYLDMSYGLSLEVVFDRFYQRVKIDDAKYIASSLTLLNKTGGNIIKVFSSIERECYNRKKLDNELKTMTSSSMFVFRLLLFLPFVMYFIIIILNKDYFKPLFTTTIGYISLAAILLLYALYIVLIKKVLRIKL